MNKKIKIALVLYTQGLDFDDRIRKEILTVRNISPNIYFKIFAVTPNNIEKTGVTSYGIPFRLPYLRTRDRYKSGGNLFNKAFDFYKTIKHDLNEFDIIWCADTEPILFLLLMSKKIIWDLHELPDRFINNFIGKIVLKYIERKSMYIIHANNERKQLLFNKKVFSITQKHLVLRNLPDFNEVDDEIDDKFLLFLKWKGNSKCVYLQGLTDTDRADIESIEAVLTQPAIKCVVVGNFKNESKEFLNIKFKEEFHKRVFFTGMIKQLKTPQYIKECFTSLIFYKNTCMNNFYCEPNRMYQNVINGNPIIVGSNPPMREFVNEFKCGVSVNTDGTDVNEIVNGLKQLMEDYNYFKHNTLNASDKLLWSNQEDVLKKICNFINTEI